MVSLVDKYFSQYDFDAIESAVKKAEQQTQGEIVIDLSSRSKKWNYECLVHAFIFSLISMAITFLLTLDIGWGVYYNVTQTILWGAVGFVVAYLGWGRFLKRQERQREVVKKRALELFHQLPKTTGLTAVLIFISLAEEQVAILADKAIAEKLPDNYWDKPHTMIVKAMSQGNHAEGVVEAIEEITTVLAENFPREDDDINELPDKPNVVD